MNASWRVWLAILAWILGVLAVAEPAAAYPWLVRDGYGTCSGCHVDPSGGELLTGYGRMVAWDRLPTRWRSAPATQETPTTALWGLAPTPAWLPVGASYRQLMLYEPGTPRLVTFPMEADVKLGLTEGRWLAAVSFGVARVPAGSPHAHAAQISRGQGNTAQLLSRYHWIGYRIGDGLVLRGGRLALPYGLRIAEHTAWVRDATRTDRESDQSHGVALSYEGGDVRGELMAAFGNLQLRPDRYRERGVVGFVETKATEVLRLGLSGLWLTAAADLDTLEQETTDRRVVGPFGRAVLGEHTALLFEIDVSSGARRDLGVVGFVQVDHELVQGLHLMATGELFDGGYRELVRGAANSVGRAPGAGQPKLGAWLSAAWFVAPGVDLRFDGVYRYQAPLALMLQAHLAF